MIITKNLVILNLPKTGSTFVRKVVKDIFFKRRNRNIFTKALNKFKLKSIGFKEIMAENPLIPGYKDQHGYYDQIPDADKHKKILAVVKDPYLRAESVYKFMWWVKYPKLEKQELSKHFPDFPNLSFERYLDLQMMLSKKVKEKYNISKDVKIGIGSIQFISFFFKDHQRVLAKLNNEYISSGSYKKDMCDVKFLCNENLNNELVSFLSKNGFNKKELGFILNHEKVNRTKSDIEENVINEKAISIINEYEWIMIKILEDFGFNYKR